MYLQMPENDLRAWVFSALVLFNMGLILINRSFQASQATAFLRPNRSLWILFSAVGLYAYDRRGLATGPSVI